MNPTLSSLLNQVSTFKPRGYFPQKPLAAAGSVIEVRELRHAPDVSAIFPENHANIVAGMGFDSG